MNISANTELSLIVSLSHFKIISSPLIWPLFVRKGFIMLQKIFIWNSTILGNIVKIFLNTFLPKTRTFISLYFVLLFILFGRVFTKIVSYSTSAIYCLSQLLVFFILPFSVPCFFQKCMTFDNLSESISNEAIILVWIICWKLNICFFQVI